MATIKGKRTKQATKSLQSVVNQPVGFVPEQAYEMFASVPGNRSSNRTGEGKETRFPYIDNGIIPYRNYDGKLSLRDPIELCQKAYFNFSAFGNTIDIMTEFTNSPLHWEGGNKASREFFKSWADVVKLWSFNDQYFRERYRGGNIPFIRLDTELTPDDINGYKQIKAQIKFNEGKVKIPRGYMILNPLDIYVENGLNYINPTYFRLLDPVQVRRLTNPQTQQDKDFYESLDNKSKKLLKDAKTGRVFIPFDPSIFYINFYKKQDYEPMAVPFGYRVLDDINFKLEMRKTDFYLARSVEQAILLITMGESQKDGGSGPNPAAIDAMQKIFQNEALGRVIVADYTTKADFIIPQIAEILGPAKYEQVDKDIREGLLAVFLGEESFSNSMTKIRVFMKRLNDSRQAYLNDFLLPEIKRIHKLMGFKGKPPTPVFEEEDLNNQEEMFRIYTALLNAGALTPEETIEAIKTGMLPDQEASLESQEKFKTYRDKDLYMSPINVAKEKIAAQKQAGRPTGAGKSIKNRKTRVVGEREPISVKALGEVYTKTNLVLAKMGERYCKENKIKKITAKIQNEVFVRAKSLFYNEKWQDWESKWEHYYENPTMPKPEYSIAIQEVMESDNLEELSAIMLWNSKEENGGS